MMNNNKILTVSYGTFSCTLEGFDDSFSTMKAIAEYFRDLASDDRYFGAEPPQPDAEMLARIAEREVERRVEAREHEGRIMLKAHDEAVTTATVAAPAAERAPVQEPVAATESGTIEEPTAAVDETSATEATEKEIEETAVEEQADEQADAQAFEDDSAEIETAAEETPAELSEEQAEAGDEIIETAAEDTAETEPQLDNAEDVAAVAMVEETVSEDDTVDEVAQGDARAATDMAGNTGAETFEHAEEDAGEDAIDLAETDEGVDAAAKEIAPEAAHEQSEDATFDETAAFFADSPFAAASDMEVEETISPEEYTAFTSLEDTDDSTLSSDAMEAVISEDVTDEDKAAEPESFADKLARIRAVVSKQDDDEIDADYDEDAETVSGGATFADMDATFAPEMDGQEDSLQQDIAQDNIMAAAALEIGEALEQDDADHTKTEIAEIATDEEDDLDAILKRIEANADDHEDALDLSALDDSDTEETENLFADDPEVTEEPAQDVQGRVLKVNRSDLEAALASGDLEEYEEDTRSFNAALTNDDDSTLQSDFAELDSEAETADADTAEVPARQSLPEIDESLGDDISRLMAEADQQMQEPEGKTRRSAFAHLRAAVAARFADGSMKEKEQLEEEIAEAYRGDLAEVVKPRRPVANPNRSERPADQRPAPLKLVAEQRIDQDEVAARGPVAPRRVAATMEEDAAASEDSGFADYAEERGAASLSELLEAAAAYLSYVEGHEQFSRPQLMSRVRQADCGDFSREDGLRSFGQLLRTGKIEKIKGGRFTASEGIGYKPDHRAAG